MARVWGHVGQEGSTSHYLSVHFEFGIIRVMVLFLEMIQIRSYKYNDEIFIYIEYI